MVTEWIQCIFSDVVMFSALHVGLLVFLICAVLGEWRMKRDIADVKRGQKSWDHFNLVYGILSVVVIQLISISEAGTGYKVIISVLDLSALFYLNFFNGWFRNKIIGLVVASQNKEE